MTGRKAAVRVVALFSLAYDPDVRLRKVTQTLASAGYQMTILAWDRSASLPREAMDGAVRVERIALSSRRGRGLTQLPYLAWLALRMVRRLRRLRPDVIHAVDLPMLGIAILARPLVGRVRIVYDAPEIYSVMVAHRFPRPVIALLRALERRLPGRADLVLTAGSARTAWFKRFGIASVPIPNWPASEPGRIADGGAAADREEARGRARRAFDIPVSSLCLAYTGAILASRDLEALLGWADRHPADRVLIAGIGDREAWLRDRASSRPNVRYLGWLADPTPVMDAADAMFYALRPDHPYAALAAPNNLYVAIQHGIPLIYRRQGEFAEVDARAEIGRAFTDDASLDRAVEELRDPAVAGAVRRSLQRLAPDYVWARAADSLLAAYPAAETAITRPSAAGP